MRRFLTDTVVIATVVVTVMIGALLYTRPMPRKMVDELPDSRIDLSTLYPLGTCHYMGPLYVCPNGDKVYYLRECDR